jgi:hypothetical protein
MYINCSFYDIIELLNIFRGRRGRDRMVVGFIATYHMESVPITSNVVRSNPDQARGTRYVT